MITVFIDQCIFSVSDTLIGVKKDGVIGYIRRTPSKKGSWLRDEFDCLPAISKLAKEKKILPTRYIELDFENWKRRAFPANLIGHLFPADLLSRVEPAIERSLFFKSSLEEHLKTARVIEFCKWLNTPDLEISLLNSHNSLPEKTKANIKDLKRYRDLCHGLEESQYVDAFHLWSAEISSIEFFLTTDKKFINVMKKTNKVNLKCIPILPSGFLSSLNVEHRADFEFKEGVFYDIAGNALGRWA